MTMTIMMTGHDHDDHVADANDNDDCPDNDGVAYDEVGDDDDDDGDGDGGDDARDGVDVVVDDDGDDPGDDDNDEADCSDVELR